MIKRTKAARKGSVKVTFVVPNSVCDRPVSVVGDFNDWDPLATPLKKRSNGTRSASLELPADQTYRFKYLADEGTWFCDDDADGLDDGHDASPDSLLVL